MYVSADKIKEALDVFRKHGNVLRTKEVQTLGVHKRTLYKMHHEGLITKLERGVYSLSDGVSLSNPDLAIIASKIPSARICLISALALHNMTNEIPHKIHIALSRSQRNPRLAYPPVQIYRFSGESLTEGVEITSINGVKVQVYNPAKTIADCFKFRNQIGKEIAIEALNRGIRERRVTYKEILHYSRICRVERVIKPYLESVTSEQ